MTLHSKIWAIGTLLLFLPLGLIIMLGHVPGTHSDHAALRGFAIHMSILVGKHGAIITGVFVMLVGVCTAAVFLVWGDYLRRTDGNSGSDLWDCGDGGD